MQLFAQTPVIVSLLGCALASGEYQINDPRIGVPQHQVQQNLSVQANGSTSRNLSLDETLDCNLMLVKVNQFRRENGKQPLKVDAKMAKAAQLHSEDQARNKKMSHSGSNGSTMAQRIDQQGYKWMGLAENVAFNQKSIDQVMTSWINSPGHKANLLGNYEDFGCGFKQYYWTQTFGKKRNW